MNAGMTIFTIITIEFNLRNISNTKCTFINARRGDVPRVKTKLHV